MARKIGVFVLFGLIVFVFVFMGVFDLSPTGSGYAARVNREIITIKDYRAAAQRMLQFYSNLMGQGRALPSEQQQAIQMRALEQLISREASLQEAEEEGIRVAPEEIRDNILEIKAFQKDGRFQRSLYESLLKNNRLSVSEFEESIAKDVKLQKLQTLFENALKPTAIEVEREWSDQNTKLVVRYLKINEAAAAKSLNISKADVDRYLSVEENKKSIKDKYEVQKDRFTKPEEVRARHILVKATQGDEKSFETALEKIKAIEKRLQSEDFAKVASETSDDPGSKAKGGDLGFFTKGRMVPEFEKIAFEGEPGKISAPVRTNFGYHLIRVEEKRPEKVTPFEEAKIELAKEEVSNDVFDKQIEELNAALQNNNKTKATQIAKNLGTKWEETAEFALSVSTIPKAQIGGKALAAVSQLTKESPLTASLIKENNTFFAAELVKRIDPKTEERDLKKVSDQLKSNRFRDSFASWSEKIREKSKVEINSQLFRN